MTSTEDITIEVVTDEHTPLVPATGDAGIPPAPPATVAAISIKLPPFWPTDPTVWFAQVEAQFSTRGITAQRTRFEYIIASLSPEFAVEVRDLLIRPPTDTPYNTLKAELIKRTAASEQRKLQQLISGEELGDRKPTQLLRRMQQLLGDHLGPSVDNAFLKELFLQRLPANVRMVLASADGTTDLAKLADMADKVVEVSSSTVAAVSHSSSTDGNEMEKLRAEVTRLSNLVASLSTSRPRRSRSFSRGRRPRSPAPTDEQPQYICWYHKKFGEAAKKCQDHCTWEKD